MRNLWLKWAMPKQDPANCPVAGTLSVIGSSWTCLILRDLLLHGARRFQDLQDSLEGIAPTTLSDRLRTLEQNGVVERRFYSMSPPRAEYLLTAKGRDEFEPLNQASANDVGKMLQRLSLPEQNRLVSSMNAIHDILDPQPDREPYLLRTHQPGDMGWVTHRHGVLYAEEYGWNEHFEALVAQIVSDFINKYNPERERCWIAEMNGEIVGSVFLVQASETEAKLRLLLVEPKARGLGLGTRLVEECIRFARRRGYQKLMLWTNSVLLEARHIYEKTGFKLIAQEAHHSFGHDLIGETWELLL